jgi:NADP-dependent 3-hydroxy acid dehydrogenase YdfG
METPLVVAITGASAGLGRAIAHAYAKRGAKLGLMARNPTCWDDIPTDQNATGLSVQLFQRPQ